jgi:hypothetical protein
MTFEYRGSDIYKEFKQEDYSGKNSGRKKYFPCTVIQSNRLE